MSTAPHSFFENTAAEVPSPDACTHLTGADHLASLSAALRSLDAQLDVVDRWGALLADVLCGSGRGRLHAACNGGSPGQAQYRNPLLVGPYSSHPPPFSVVCLSA